MGLLHALINAEVVFEPRSAIAQFIDALHNPPGFFFTEKTPLERAQSLESTDIFTNIHAGVAAGGQTAVPGDLDTDLHLTRFVEAPEARRSRRLDAPAAQRVSSFDELEGNCVLPRT